MLTVVDRSQSRTTAQLQTLLATLLSSLLFVVIIIANGYD